MSARSLRIGTRASALARAIGPTLKARRLLALYCHIWAPC